MSGRIFTKAIFSWLLPLFILLAFILQQLWGVTLESSMELSNNPEILIDHPWSIFSYSLLHNSYLHFGINIGLLLLILLGNKLSPKEVWGLFSVSAIMGGVIFMMIPGGEASIIGASAGITALIAVSIHRLFIHHKRWMLILPAIILLDLLTQGFSFSLGFTVHLSGYIIGLLYALYSSKGYLDKKLLDEDAQDSISEIISKANISGYQSLTDEEQKKLITSVDK